MKEIGRNKYVMKLTKFKDKPEVEKIKVRWKGNKSINNKIISKSRKIKQVKREYSEVMYVKIERKNRIQFEVICERGGTYIDTNKEFFWKLLERYTIWVLLQYYSFKLSPEIICLCDLKSKLSLNFQVFASTSACHWNCSFLID